MMYRRAFFVFLWIWSSVNARPFEYIYSVDDIGLPMPLLEFLAWNVYIVIRILVWKWESPSLARQQNRARYMADGNTIFRYDRD